MDASVLNQDLSPHRCATCPARATCVFARLPQYIYEQFQVIVETAPYSRGVTIFRQGEEADGLFIIRSGSVKLYNLTPAGKTTILGIAGPGAVLGLTEIITGSQYEVSADVLERSELEHVARGKFTPFLRAHPMVSVWLLKAVCYELQKSLAELCRTTSRIAVRERLLHTLVDLSVTCGQTTADGIKLKLSVTIQDLADRVGCSRQWTSRILSEMEKQGLINRKAGWITVTPLALNESGLNLM